MSRDARGLYFNLFVWSSHPRLVLFYRSTYEKHSKYVHTQQGCCIRGAPEGGWGIPQRNTKNVYMVYRLCYMYKTRLGKIKKKRGTLSESPSSALTPKDTISEQCLQDCSKHEGGIINVTKQCTITKAVINIRAQNQQNVYNGTMNKVSNSRSKVDGQDYPAFVALGAKQTRKTKR